MTPREAIEAAELAEAETTYRHQLAREMYQAGQRAGFQAGYRQADADQAAAWAKVTRPRHPRHQLRRARGTPLGTRRPRPLRRAAPRRLPRPGRQTPPRTRNRTRNRGRMMTPPEPAEAAYERHLQTQAEADQAPE